MPERREVIEHDGRHYTRTVIIGRPYDPRPVAFLLGGMAVVKRCGDVWNVESWIMDPNPLGGGPMMYSRSISFWRRLA